MAEHQPEQNKILIAKPFLQDGFFRRAIVLLAEHNESGSVGFVMNRPMYVKLKDIISNLKNADFPVYLGGPVSQDQLFFIHRCGEHINGSLPIGGGYFWNGDYSDLISLIRKGKISTKEIKFFLGYSGWGEGQLHDELESDSWIVSDANYKNLMRDASNEIWGDELKRIGSNYNVLSNFPQDPWMN
ncbi:MAG: YqgE/AlgH family protein [Bacteroidota bacterium]|jgi:putative transcriptional regulator